MSNASLILAQNCTTICFTVNLNITLVNEKKERYITSTIKAEEQYSCRKLSIDGKLC